MRAGRQRGQVQAPGPPHRTHAGKYQTELPHIHKVIHEETKNDIFSVQRVLKYHLILRELMSNTAAAHEEHHLIQQAYEAMLDVSDYINEVSESIKSPLWREIQIECVRR